MNKRTVVSPNNLPMKWPVVLTWLCFLSQSTWAIPEWLWGVMWAFVIIMWIVAGVDIFNREDRDLFESKGGTT